MRILQVFVVGTSKVMSAAEIFLRTHIQIVVVHKIEHCIYASYRRNAYRSRWKTWMVGSACSGIPSGYSSSRNINLL